MPNSLIDRSGYPSEIVTPLLVRLPPELSDFFTRSGYTGSASTEDRTAARLNARFNATMEFSPAPLALVNAVAQRPTLATVLIKDLSKIGVGVLIHCQVYPTERAKIHFRGRDLHITVQRCQRLGPMCYEIGAAVERVEQT